MTISRSTCGRLPLYARELRSLLREGCSIVLSTDLAKKIGVSAESVRRDLLYLPCSGLPGVGYPVAETYHAIKYVLEGTGKKIVLVGTNYMARALWEDPIIEDCGFTMLGVFGIPADGHSCWDNVTVRPLEELATWKEKRSDIGIISVSAEWAQHAADKLIEAGIRGIWNFSSANLTVPSHIHLSNFDISRTLGFLVDKLTREELRKKTKADKELEKPVANKILAI